jgi:hypothetical protein
MLKSSVLKVVKENLWCGIGIESPQSGLNKKS